MKLKSSSPWGGTAVYDTGDAVWRSSPPPVDEHLARIAAALERIAAALEKPDAKE